MPESHFLSRCAIGIVKVVSLFTQIERCKFAVFACGFVVMLVSEFGMVKLAVGASRTPNREAQSEYSALQGIDLKGRKHRLGEVDQTQAVVVVFLSTQCPISNAIIPSLRKIHAKFRKRGVEVFGVVSSPYVTRADARRHQAEFRISFPVLFDASGELQRILRPSHTPHAFILSAAGRRMYDGAIDGTFVEPGRKASGKPRDYLRTALAQVLSGQAVSPAKTKPVGCLLEKPAAEKPRGDVTFSRDIAPIIQANCVECHRSGQSAPFPLMTYRDVSSHARQIVEVTHSKRMPPWKPEPGFGEFRDERRLTAREIGLIKAWAANGKPIGDSDDLPLPLQFSGDWQLGQPDVILEMSQDFELPASGPDIHQHFVMPVKGRSSRLIAAVEFQPGNPRVIHHASFYVDTTKAARRLDEADPSLGYGSFPGPGFGNEGSLRSWLPGMRTRRLPAGMGRLMERGSDVVLEVHYQMSGKRESDCSRLGLYYAPRGSQQLVLELQVQNRALAIPAGKSRHHHRSAYTLPVDATLLDVAPHMHLLGREMKAVAVLPNGRKRPLIWIRDWEFNWQGQYTYRKPVELPAGTRIEVDSWYDNSAGNPFNPTRPPVTVKWGNSTTDEMDICHFQYTCRSLKDLRLMGTQHQQFANRGGGASGRTGR